MLSQARSMFRLQWVTFRNISHVILFNPWHNTRQGHNLKWDKFKTVTWKYLNYANADKYQLDFYFQFHFICLCFLQVNYYSSLSHNTMILLLNGLVVGWKTNYFHQCKGICLITVQRWKVKAEQLCFSNTGVCLSVTKISHKPPNKFKWKLHQVFIVRA